MKVTIAIDPGMTGAISWRAGKRVIGLAKMPETPADLAIFMRGLNARYDKSFAWLEKNSGYVPGTRGDSAAKFSRQLGQVEGVLAALEIPYDYVRPTKWMKAVLGTVPKDYNDRKRAVKAKIQRLYPEVKLILQTADAMGILEWAIQRGT